MGIGRRTVLRPGRHWRSAPRRPGRRRPGAWLSPGRNQITAAPGDRSAADRNWPSYEHPRARTQHARARTFLARAHARSTHAHRRVVAGPCCRPYSRLTAQSGKIWEQSARDKAGPGRQSRHPARPLHDKAAAKQVIRAYGATLYELTVERRCPNLA